MAEHDWYPPEARVQKCRTCGVVASRMGGKRTFLRSKFEPGEDGSISPNDAPALDDCQDEMAAQVFDE